MLNPIKVEDVLSVPAHIKFAFAKGAARSISVLGGQTQVKAASVVKNLVQFEEDGARRFVKVHNACAASL